MSFEDPLYLDMEDVIQTVGADAGLAIKPREHVFLYQDGRVYFPPSKAVLRWEDDAPGRRAAFMPMY